MKDFTKHDATRRNVLKWSGVGLGLFAFGRLPAFGISEALAADLGAGDIGILNYAYALEQLEAAFYTMAVSSPYASMKADEGQVLADIRDHEIAHREFFKKALGSQAIPDLDVDFSAVDFSSRKSVLTTAKTFEDLGVSAYNGAGKLLKNVDYLAAAGTIVSVEARHAATIRDLLSPLSASFAGSDVVDKSGLDVVRSPGQVLPKAAPFIKTPVTANQL
ncbi:MAG TPA: ferritin-like domain-containing protein [Bauldia sp.]|nr:ferritin-like domain-containing protein [Bauldia sp.]